MVLKKEGFYDLGIFELLQNVWCYVDTMTERGGKNPNFYTITAVGMKKFYGRKGPKVVTYLLAILLSIS